MYCWVCCWSYFCLLTVPVFNHFFRSLLRQFKVFQKDLKPGSCCLERSFMTGVRCNTLRNISLFVYLFIIFLFVFYLSIIFLPFLLLPHLFFLEIVEWFKVRTQCFSEKFRKKIFFDILIPFEKIFPRNI